MRSAAFTELDLLASVVAFKDKFYHRGWTRYDLAKPGTMSLYPPPHVRKSLEADYKEMEFMFYGKRPAFVDLMTAIEALEHEINAL